MTTARLGDVILRSRKQVDPVAAGVKSYVGGGHIDTESVLIERRGEVGDGHMGSTFRYVFEPGQVLFVSARPYLKKVGVPDFGGVVADKTYVLSANPDGPLLHALLPFLLVSPAFVSYATKHATGSMNPRLLWGAMQEFEVDLPSHDAQRRAAALLWSVERHRQALRSADLAASNAGRLAFDHYANAGSPASVDSVATLNPEQVRGWPKDRKIRYVDISAVGQNFSGIREEAVQVLTLGEAPGRARRVVRAGDILVSNVRPALRSAAVVPAIFDGEVVSTGFTVVRPKPGVRGDFLWGLIRSDRFVDDMVSRATGSNYPAVRAVDVGRHEFRLPSERLQEVAASTLYRVDASRTALADEAQRLNELMGTTLNTLFGGN